MGSTWKFPQSHPKKSKRFINFACLKFMKGSFEILRGRPNAPERETDRRQSARLTFSQSCSGR